MKEKGNYLDYRGNEFNLPAKLFFYLLLCLLFFQANVSAQDKPVSQPQALLIEATGTVIDTEGETLPGVSIRVKGTNMGSNSDINGNFRVPTLKNAKQTILVFSYVGMETQEVEFVGKPLKIVMKEGIELSEVVVTGIFNKPKESYTGAAISITNKELQQAGNRDVLSSIRNIDPSFNIATNINLGSDPNNLPSITIRGNSSLPVGIKDLQEDSRNLNNSNQPLFVMDGFEVSLARVMDMDENLVESITLLKDASATAMYGTRGSNGVVVITTRKPPKGRLQISYKGNLNIEIPDLNSYDLMNAREKLEFEKSAGLYESTSGTTQQSLNDLYNLRKLEIERGVNTYWIKQPVRTAVGSRHSLNIEGGEESFRYGAGISYNNIEGTMKGSSRNSFNGNMLLLYKVKNLTFQNNLQILSSNSMNSPYGNFQSYAKINSYWSPYDNNGDLIKKLEDNYKYPNIETRNNVYNPLYNASLPSKNESRYQQIINNLLAEWYIIPEELFFRAKFSITSENNRSDVYISANNTKFDKYPESEYSRKGEYRYGTGQAFGYEGEITFNYSKTFNKRHALFAGVGYNVAENKTENYSIVAEGFSIANMDFLGMANQYEQGGKPYAYESISRRLGGMLNTSYTYDRRYFADLSGKLEASSQFGGNNRLAPFGAIGIGWNIYNESFLKDNKVIDIARLKLSYGITGTQSFSPYQALVTYKDNGGNNYKGWHGVFLMALGNPDLAWQKTRQYNLGTEWVLLNNRFRINVDVYNKVTNNLLTDITVPTSSGFSSYVSNVGKVQNRGIEVMANMFIIQNKQSDFSWSVGGALAHNKNKIKEISNSLEFLNDELTSKETINPSFLYKEGESMNTIFAVRSKGIDPSNGLEIFIKRDGTETYEWDPKDQVACGVAEPAVIGTLNTNIRYKGIGLTAFFRYTIGGQIYNSTLSSKVENMYPYENGDRRVLYDRWKQPGDIVAFKSVRDFSKTYATSRFIMNENSFIGQSISLSYDLPSAWTQKHLMSKYISIKIFTEDFLYLSTVKRERGIEYPYSRKFSLSLTARF